MKFRRRRRKYRSNSCGTTIKIKEVHEEEQELHEEFNASGDDEIKIINADTFPVHLQPDANGYNIIRSVLGRPFVKFRDILNRNQLEDFFLFWSFS